MTDRIPSTQHHFIHLAYYASLALGIAGESIKQLFSDKEYCLLEHFDDKNKSAVKIIEIRLRGATLNCLFDDRDRCTVTMLFLDSLNDVHQYIATCNRLYEYSYSTQKWTSLCNSYIELKIMKDDVVFVFSPLSNEQNESVTV